LQKQCGNQDKGKERARTPRFILVHPFSRATSNFFATSKEIHSKITKIN